MRGRVAGADRPGSAAPTGLVPVGAASHKCKKEEKIAKKKEKYTTVKLDHNNR